MRQLRLTTILIVLLVSIQVVSAQAVTCQVLAETAFTALQDGCSDTAANSLCYAMGASVEGDGDSFSELGDTVSLDGVQRVSTAALNLDESVWGMARLNVHGNVPISVSETGLTYILVGDAQLENSVAPDNAFVPVAPISVQTVVGANLRSAPTTDARVVESVGVGTVLNADGVNGDSSWLHITSGDTVAWVSAQIVVAVDGAISDLPVLSNDARTMMQSFVLQTGTGESACSAQSPSVLIVQSPDGVQSTITVNGVDIRVSGTTLLRNLEDNLLQLIVLDGIATNGVLSVPPGFAVTTQLDENGLLSDGIWMRLRPISDDERDFLSIFGQMPEPVFYNAVQIPTQDEVLATLTSINQANVGTAQVVSGGSGNCTGLKPTSPLDGLAFGPTTFYWDGTSLATQYRVNVFTDGELAHSETIDAFATTHTMDTATAFIGDGSSYAWNVEAIANGQTICTSGSVTLLRESAPQRASGGGGGSSSDDGDGGGNTCTWSC